MSLKSRVARAWSALLGHDLQTEFRRDIPPITSEDIEEIKSFFPMPKFFIFGHARSGTTMLARAIRIHPEVHCNYQAHFFTRPPLLESLVNRSDIGSWLSRSSNRWNQGRDLSPIVLRVCADYILEREARRMNKLIVGDKSPSSLMDGKAVELMHKVYPDGSLIYIIRDGRDTVISHRFQAFIEFPERLTKEDQDIRAHFAHNPEHFLSGQYSIFTEKSLRQAAKAWARNVDETNQSGRSLFHCRYLSLRYEDLLEHPWLKMLSVWEFLAAGEISADLEPVLNNEFSQNPDAEWQLEKASEIAQALNKGRHGSWQELFTSKDKEIFEQIAGTTLRAWGYESS